MKVMGAVFVGNITYKNRLHCRPHNSATPRDETDTGQHDSLKTNDMRDETDTPQLLASFF
jgi:hypothetical protein